MKRIILLAVFLSLPVFAQLDENSSFEQYAEACQQGNESACNDGWYYKVTRPISMNDSGEPTLKETFLTKLEEVCSTDKTKMCDAGLYMLSTPLENANNESATGNEKANEVFKKFTTTNCKILKEAGAESTLCSRVSYQEDSKLTIEDLTAQCLNSRDNTICAEAYGKADKLLMSAGTFLDTVCTPENLNTLPVCEPIVTANRLAEEARIKAEEDNKKFWQHIIYSVLGIIGAGFAFVTITTRCPSCKKFYCFHTVSSKHTGTEFSHSKNVQVKTGEIKDSNYNTIATIHGNKTMNVFKKSFLNTHRCNKCGFTSQSTSSKTESHNA